MSISKSSLLAGTCALVALPLAALAEPVTHSGKSGVKFERMIATVNVSLTDTNTITVDMTGGSADYTIEQSANGDAVLLRGPAKPKSREFYKAVDWRRYGEDAVKRYMEDYQVITITAPVGTNLTFDEFVSVVSVTGDAGDVEMEDSVYVEGVLGNAASADIGMGGSGDLAFGNIAGELRAAIGGSGDMRFGSAGKTSVAIGGSGDVVVGNINGPVKATIGGSGDIRFGDVNGDATYTIGGSGDIESGALKGLTVNVGGSGDIEAASVNGPVKVRVAGSGEVDIDEGTATSLEVSIAGSGSLSFNGKAVNPEVSVYGSGDVYVASYEGNVRISGDKDDIRIGDYRP